MLNELNCCNICPRNCSINRNSGEKGYCNCDDKIKIALVSTHYYEEPCISGKTINNKCSEGDNSSISNIDNEKGRVWYNFF